MQYSKTEQKKHFLQIPTPKKNWIRVNIKVNVRKEKKNETEKGMKKYANELGWEVHPFPHEHDKDKTVVGIFPPEKNSLDRDITPQKFLKIRDKLFEITENIAEEFKIQVSEEEEETAELMAFDQRDKEGKTMFRVLQVYHYFYKTMLVLYNIENRIIFEKKNEGMSKEIFGNTMEDFIKNVENNERLMKEDFSRNWVKNAKTILKELNKPK